jgi:hypothetical protein
MCNQVALGVLGIGGGVLEGIGAAQTRENNAQTYEMNARGLERDIASEKERSAYEIARTRETIQRTLGSARAGHAANGLALSGSVADTLQDTAIEGALDLEAIRWSSGEKVKSLGYQAGVYRYNAKQERAGKALAFIAPVIGSAARFGGNFGQN